MSIFICIKLLKSIILLIFCLPSPFAFSTHLDFFLFILAHYKYSHHIVRIKKEPYSIQGQVLKVTFYRLDRRMFISYYCRIWPLIHPYVVIAHKFPSLTLLAALCSCLAQEHKLLNELLFT